MMSFGGSERLRKYLPSAGWVCIISGMLGIVALALSLLRNPCPDDCQGVALALLLFGLGVGLGVVQLTTSARMQDQDLRWLKAACIVFYLIVIPLVFPFSLLLLLLIPTLIKLLDPARPLGAALASLRLPLVVLGIALTPLSLFGLLGMLGSIARGSFAELFIFAGGTVVGPGCIMAAIGLTGAKEKNETVSRPD